ncbi:hypothetical protein [Lysobacter capsici]|uniref:hypothetical protein n=1 Tax=Lysobacter capsici TaxID=435897 RepID=UPI00287B820F|nr:hypothetical protein [Lysobacter capsici]WND79410.1 hypothetical protein RJ610_19215 [Lysobacter capsici]WND84606.1 hypothetical protein RJ609_19230 [Lysobacter capsici]
MNAQSLPPLEFSLTPADEYRAAVARDQIDAHRRRLNDLDRRRESAQDARALERALEQLP